jgi:hypothetical protein
MIEARRKPGFVFPEEQGPAERSAGLFLADSEQGAPGYFVASACSFLAQGWSSLAHNGRKTPAAAALPDC